MTCLVNTGHYSFRMNTGICKTGLYLRENELYRIGSRFQSANVEMNSKRLSGLVIRLTFVAFHQNYSPEIYFRCQGSVWRLPTSDPIFCHSLGLKKFFSSVVNMSQLWVIFHLMSKKVLVTGNGVGLWQSYLSGPWFESHHRPNFSCEIYLCSSKDKKKEKYPWKGTFYHFFTFYWVANNNNRAGIAHIL